MAISTYLELQSAIATWTVRSDMTSRMGDIISLAEADIRKDVRCQAMETLEEDVLTGETLDFPDGMIWPKEVKRNGYLLDYRTPQDYSEMSRKGSSEYVYTIIGQSIYFLQGVSGDDYSLIYWKSFDSFTSNSDTNWLLTNHPDVYLWAGCAKVALVTKDDKALGRFSALYSDAVRKVNRNEWMVNGPLRVKPNGGNTP